MATCVISRWLATWPSSLTSSCQLGRTCCAPGADSHPPPPEKLHALFDWDLCFPQLEALEKKAQGDYGSERNDCQRTGGWKRQSQSANSLIRGNNLCRICFSAGVAQQGWANQTHNDTQLNEYERIVAYAQHGLCCLSTKVEKESCVAVKDVYLCILARNYF